MFDSFYVSLLNKEYNVLYFKKSSVVFQYHKKSQKEHHAYSECWNLLNMLYDAMWIRSFIFLLFGLFRLTGFQIPAPVTSTGSVFSLRLTSDFAVSAHGFKIYYEGKDSSPLCVVLCIVTLYCHVLRISD